MDPVPTNLPPLSPDDSARLLRLFALHLDLQALARELAPRENLITLYCWSVRHEIAAYIAHHRTQEDNRLRQVAIAALESVLKTADPIESRRAATTLLRAINNRPSGSPSLREGAGGKAPARHPPTSRAPVHSEAPAKPHRYRVFPPAPREHELLSPFAAPETPHPTPQDGVAGEGRPALPLPLRQDQNPPQSSAALPLPSANLLQSGIHIATPPQTYSSKPSMTLSEALAALGLPSLEDMDRLDDEEDDAELDDDFPEDSDFNPSGGPPVPDTMPP